MNESKRFKITKREKESFIETNPQKDLTIEQAFEHQKIKNHALNQKNQKLQIKCKLLYEKYKPQPDAILGDINEDILDIDKKIKQLQEQLYFRYSKQMLKLKQKIKNFLQLINFDIEDTDLEQLKYDELTSQNQETFELIQKLREPEQISGITQRIKQLQDELGFYMKENRHLQNLTKDYERELIHCKNILEEQKNFEVSKENGESIETQRAIQKYKNKISQLESEKAVKDLQIQKRNKRIAELQNQLDLTNKKAKSIFQEFQRFKRDDTKWKDRYSHMQEQKNQRIRLLQMQLNRRMGIANSDESGMGYSFKNL